MPRYMQYTLIAVVAILAAIAGHFAAREMKPATTTPTAAADPTAAAALFALQLPDASGTPQALAQWQGKILVINFWATWCPPCRKEIPDFADAARAFSADPVQFVGLSIDSAEAVQDFSREFDVPYPLLIASPQVLGLAARFGNSAQALPFTVILDRNGAVRHVKLGTLNRAELEGKIRSLIAP